MFYGSCFAFDYIVDWLDREGAQDREDGSQAWRSPGFLGFGAAPCYSSTWDVPLAVDQTLEKERHVMNEEKAHVN